jgi:ABC-type molybdenum transport system ATPase subunit/photorepair protein PhrA
MSGDQQIHGHLPKATSERPIDVSRAHGFEDRRRTAQSDERQSDVAIPAIEFRDVNFSYEDKKVLNDLSFQLAKGEIKIIPGILSPAV